MPVKNYVFDTNVLIHDPNSIFRFQDNDIYIPIYVLEELDGLKSDPGQRGFSAREAIRIIDDLRTTGDLSKGVQIHKDCDLLPEGMNYDKSGKLFVYAPKKRASLITGLKDLTDNAILQSALDIKESFKCEGDLLEYESKYERRTILVTMDINLRVRAEGMGIQVAQYEFQSVDISTLGNEVKKVIVPPEDLSELHKSKIVYIKDIPGFEESEYELNNSLIIGAENTNQTALCRVKKITGEKVFSKVNLPKHVLGIKPRNAEQHLALDLLLDENVQLVTIMGRAGTGKTILSIAAGLYQVIENNLYDKLLIARPAIEMGKGIGFIPGSIEEKMQPYMQPFYDNLDYIMMSSGSKKKHGNLDDLFDNGTIQIEPLTFIRGRSIPNQFILVDEAQNLSTLEIKTIITRCGENTKIVLTGDIDQIDSPYLSKSSNGLSVSAKKLRNNHMVGHLALQKGERSALATLAADEL